jgi:hypothetical protein
MLRKRDFLAGGRGFQAVNVDRGMNRDGFFVVP